MIKNDKIRHAFLATVGFLVLGTVGYRLIEHYPLLDSLYMTVITISTVGFGEIHTLSPVGRVFTIFLILFGFGSIGFLAHAFTEQLIERASSQKLGKRTMQKRIQQLRDHYIICGFGRVGEAAAEHFLKVGAQFVVIESDAEQIAIIKEQGYAFLEGDATRENFLLAAGIKQASALMALLNADPENLFTVLTARELNPTLHIIARTEMASSESRMLRAGADSIISPYASAGRRVADKILSHGTDEKKEDVLAADRRSEAWWEKVTEQSNVENHVVDAASTLLGGHIIGIRRDGRDILMPAADEEICRGDELLIAPFDLQQKPDKHTASFAQKIVLVDDNPVIRRLYTRLFQKAGYRIVTASNGKDGLRLIMAEKPNAAVIDFHLPDITGIQVCEKIRRSQEMKNIKLFLFTGDDEEQTREKALTIGVDNVVVKSPDAAEIVDSVRRSLEKYKNL